jgi:hypothetical protein
LPGFFFAGFFIGFFISVSHCNGNRTDLVIGVGECYRAAQMIVVADFIHAADLFRGVESIAGKRIN